MPRNIKALAPLAIMCALLATVAVAACSSPAATANTAPQTLAPTTVTPLPRDPVPQQLWGTWQPTVPGDSLPHMVLAAHGVAFYPTASAQDPKIALAWVSGPDQITFGTTEACDTVDTYVWKISNGALSFTGGDTDECGRHQNLIGYSWTRVSTSTSPADTAS